MTMYTEDVNYRMRTVFFILAVLSVLLALVLRHVLPAYPRIIAPAALMFYATLFWLFDAILWKLPVVRLLNSGIPNLAGLWQGSLSRIVDGRPEQLEVSLTIRQTWSKFNTVLRTSEAQSRNTLLGLRLKDPNAIVLTWVYRIDGSDSRSIVESGMGVIELILHKKTPRNNPSMEGALLTGALIEIRPGEPFSVTFKKPGPFYWNPEPF